MSNYRVTPLYYFIFGFVAGMLGLLFFDPLSGARRRRLAARQVSRRWRDLSQRTQGLALQVSGLLADAKLDVDNLTLIERVRAQLGRVLRSARDVQVEADRGVVTLRGQVWSDEIRPLIARVERIPGVKKVHEMLKVNERRMEAGNETRSHGRSHG